MENKNASFRNIVAKMPVNTAMGHLQAHHPELLTKSGAISVVGWNTAQEALNNTHKILKRELRGYTNEPE